MRSQIETIYVYEDAERAYLLFNKCRKMANRNRFWF